MSNMLPIVKVNKSHEFVIELLKQNNPQTCMKFARSGFTSGKTRPLDFRKQQLLQLQKFLNENEDRIIKVLGKDLNKPRHECLICELDFVRNDLKNVLWNLKNWNCPKVVNKKFIFMFDKTIIYNDPLGVVLVIGAWNHPIRSCVLPLASCIAAGNCFILKPSTVSMHTAQFLADTLPHYLDETCYRVYLGHKKEILLEKFDYIVYSGGENMGAVVCKAAAIYKTPVTVVLGGKNPVYVDETANFNVVARRIMYGKCVNAGQACIAPEYILCCKEVEKLLLEAIKVAVKDFYTEDPKNSRDYSKIISEKQFDKLVSMITNNNVAFGGHYDKEVMYVSPTILTDVSANSEILREEIYGPILAVITIHNIDDAIAIINSKEKPLCMYIFSRKQKDVKRILENTSAGGVTINDTLTHVLLDTLPYGGVGDSGMGNCRGKALFDSMVNKKSVFHRTQIPLLEKMQFIRYPPYTDTNTRILQMLLRNYKCFPLSFCKSIFPLLLGIVVGAIFACLYILYAPLKRMCYPLTL